MSDICRYCKAQGNNFQKLTPELLKFVRWKVPSVTANDLFCKKCYKILKTKYELVKKKRKIKETQNVTTTSEESIVSSILTINGKNNNLRPLLKNAIELKERIINETNNSDDSSVHPSSFSITDSEEFTEIEKNSPKKLRLVQQSIQPFVHHVAKNSKSASIIQMKEGLMRKNQLQENSILGRDNNQSILPQRILPEMEEVEYEGSDEDIFDPGVPLPTIQPLIKRRKVVRSKREPLNWSYKLGG